MNDQDVQRSLGRIEGAQAQILTELRNLRTDFGQHKDDDQKNFSLVRKMVYDKFAEQEVARNERLDQQDTKLDDLKQDSDRAKGAGYVILAIIGALASFVGASVIAVLSGWVKIPHI